MALIITHATVAGNPQTPLLDDTDWNANHSLSGSVAWGEITGTLSAQTDLQTALDAKASLGGANFTGAVEATEFTTTGNSIKFENSGFTATLQSNALSADRIISFPNSTGTLANVSSSQTLTNKTIDGANNTLTVLGASQISGDVPFSNIDQLPANSVAANPTTGAGDIQAVALSASQLLGRGDSGNVAPIVLGTNLSMSGTTLNAAGGSGSPGGASGNVQYNNGGVFDGAANIEIENDNLRLPAISTPAAPAADGLNLFARKISGRMFPAFIGPSGLDSALQPLLARNKIGYWCPPGNGSTVPGVLGFTAPTVTGFTATARNVATTRFFTRMRRLGYVTAATAGSVGQWRHSSMQFTIGDGSTLGGFTYIIRFGTSDAATVAGARMFMGMCSNATPTNVEPSTITNCVGIGHGAADTNLKLFYGGSAAQTPIDLGANFPINTLSVDMYELALFAPVNSQVIHYEVTRLNTGDVATGTLSGTVGTVIPAATTLIGPWGYRTNNATALAVGIDVASAYIETDY